MKASAVAPANIAFIKYWGKRDENLRLPDNSSISVNLSRLLTTTTVEFSSRFSQDRIKIDGYKNRKAVERVIRHLERIRQMAGVSFKARVVSKSNFPYAAGLASSASGFAALTLAASRAVGLLLPKKQLSRVARLGSGSACRSIPDGFVEWKRGDSDQTSYAVSLYPSDYWDITVLAVLVGQSEKSVSSTLGMKLAKTSPFYPFRLKLIEKKITKLKQALREKNFSFFGEIVEVESLEFHSIAMTSRPACFYWLPATVAVMRAVKYWRTRGMESYFTIDAGANVFVICQEKNRQELFDRINKIKGVKQVIANKPAKGARLTGKHLF